MLELGSALRELSTKWGNKLDELSPGTFRFDVGIKLKDGSLRFQFVYLWLAPGQNGGRDKIYMNSRCGMYSSNINLYNILKECGYCNYSTLTVTDDKLADGTPCETIIVQASPFLDSTSIELLGDIIWEVAFNADYVEGKFYGGDKN